LLRDFGAILLAFPAFAATQATNANTVSSTLRISVIVQHAIQLTLATGSLCTVNTGSGTDYSISFGNVDTPTDYTLTPIFTSQCVTTNTITAYVSTNCAKNTLTVVQPNSSPAAIGILAAMGTTAGAQTTIATNATNGTAITRYIGVEVAPTNGASLTGADSATITYTITVQ
jgi:hypothetical protein